MNYLEAVLLAEARRIGRAQRSALCRHRHIACKPLGLLLWQLGAEPFTAAAVAWGFGPNDRKLVVSGEPRNRELAFRALAEVAHSFNRWFERGSAENPPQIIVPNRGNLSLLGRLGRRLSYLPTSGTRPADPELVRFGRHLGFLADHARHPGQQLVLVLTELLAAQWVSELSPLESQSLPALDAAIAPPPGMTGHEAAVEAEKMEIGPLPTEADDSALDPLVAAFNEARSRRTEERIVAPLREPIRRHYERLIYRRGWPLLWGCLERERAYPEGEHVARRWKEDGEAFARHADWVVAQGGRYRVRDTHAKAAHTLRIWEEARRLLEAEEALDDPFRMAPYFLSNEAIRGTVVEVDLDHTEPGAKRQIRRPRFVLETEEPCVVPVDAELYWTETPDGREYRVVEVRQARRKGGSCISLQHETGFSRWERPRKKTVAIFSIHHLGGSPPLRLPSQPPWPHRAAPASETRSIRNLEDPSDDRGWE